MYIITIGVSATAPTQNITAASKPRLKSIAIPIVIGIRTIRTAVSKIFFLVSRWYVNGYCMAMYLNNVTKIIDRKGVASNNAAAHFSQKDWLNMPSFPRNAMRSVACNNFL